MEYEGFSEQTRMKITQLTEEAVAFVLASTDIDEQRYVDCVDDLEKAYQYSIVAEKLLPHRTVIDRITSAQSEISSESILVADINLVPIVASLSEVSGLDPQKKVEVETSIVKAELALSNNDRKLAMEILDKVKDSLVIKVVEIDVVGLTRLSKAALAFAKVGKLWCCSKGD